MNDRAINIINNSTVTEETMKHIDDIDVDGFLALFDEYHANILKNETYLQTNHWGTKNILPEKHFGQNDSISVSEGLELKEGYINSGKVTPIKYNG